MKGDAATTRGKQPGKPWPKGVSGNPAGRPTGSRHKASLAAEALFNGDAEKLTRKAISMALQGDAVAMRLCLERVCPPRRDRPLQFTLPTMKTAADAPAALAAITDAVAKGELSTSEASDLAGLVERFVRSIELSDHEARIAALETKDIPK